VLFEREDRLGRDRAIVEQLFDLGELGAHEAPKGWRDVDVMASEFESHWAAFSFRRSAPGSGCGPVDARADS
jgi:hypothetical protein